MTVNVTHADKSAAAANISFMKIQLEIMVKNGPSVTLISKRALSLIASTSTY